MSLVEVESLVNAQLSVYAGEHVDGDTSAEDHKEEPSPGVHGRMGSVDPEKELFGRIRPPKSILPSVVDWERLAPYLGFITPVERMKATLKNTTQFFRREQRQNMRRH